MGTGMNGTSREYWNLEIRETAPDLENLYILLFFPLC